MNLKKMFRKAVVSKWNLVLAVQASCFASSLAAGEQTADHKKVNVSPFNKINFKDVNKPNFKIGYDADVTSNRKLTLAKSESAFSFSKSKGVFHGPKFEISSDPISGFLKIGRTNYSFKGSNLGSYRGFGFGIGGEATFYKQDDLSLAFELAYFGGRASSKQESSFGNNYNSDFVKLNGISGIFDDPTNFTYVDNEGNKFEFPENSSCSNNQTLIDANGNYIGERIGLNWYVKKGALVNAQQDTSEQSSISFVRNFTKIKQSEMSARLVVKKQLGDFSPYLGLGYVADKSTFYEKGKDGHLVKQSNIKAVNKNKIGPFIGCNFAKNDKFNFGFEAQFLNRNSLKVAGSYSF